MHTAPSSPSAPDVTRVRARTSVRPNPLLVAILAALTPGCVQPASTLRALWRDPSPPPVTWSPVAIEAAGRVGPEGDYLVQTRMDDGRRVDDRVAPASVSSLDAPWRTTRPFMPQWLGQQPERALSMPAKALRVATRAPDLPRLELRGHELVLVEVEGGPGEVFGRYVEVVPGTSGERWRTDRLWLRALATPPAAALDVALFVLDLPFHVLFGWRGVHT